MDSDKKVRCTHCHKAVDLSSNFCNHCGNRIKSIKYKAIKCNKCGKESDSLHTYCPHCGNGLKAGGSMAALSRVLSVIAGIAIVVLIFMIAFGDIKGKNNGVQDVQSTLSVDLSDLSCKWEGNLYKICGKAAWNGKGGSYLKIYVPGADIGDSEVIYKNNEQFCYRSDDKDGFKVVKGVIYDQNGNSIHESGVGVECSGKTSEIKKPTKTKKEYNFQKKMQFSMYSNLRNEESDGVISFVFPDDVIKCKYDGRFLINDYTFTAIKSYCDGGNGEMSGSANALTQNVITDPGLFFWNGKVKANPEPVYHEGYLTYVDICSNDYYNKKENYAKAKISGFGTNVLTVGWNYYDKERRKRNIDVSYDMDCVLKEKS